MAKPQVLVYCQQQTWVTFYRGLSLAAFATISILQTYLAILSTYHLISGGISFVAPSRAMAFYKSMYAVDPIERRHLSIILRPWGALSIGMGLVGWFAAVEPVRYWGVILALLVLLVLRAIYRVVLRHELMTISQIPPRRNLMSVAVILAGVVIMAIGLGFILFRPTGA